MSLSEPKTKTVEKQNSEGPINPFLRAPRLIRSPQASVVAQGTPPNGEPPGAPSQPEKPTKKSKPSLADILRKNDKGSMSYLEYATKLSNDLSAFVATKNNIHNDIKVLTVQIQKALQEANKEWKVHNESTQKKVAELEGMVTPLTSQKRVRPSPESPLTPVTVKRQRKAPKPLQKSRDDKEWEVVKKKARLKPAKKPQPREAAKVRPKSDALLIEAKDPKSYAEILRKVKKDPKLKELGSLVTRIRRTKNGEMLFELKGDPSIKSVTFKPLIEGVLEGEATVRALTQESVVECRNIDEITSEEELREELIAQFPLVESGKTAGIKLRKTYGGMQIATIRLPVTEANMLLEKGKIKVGWTICPLLVPQTKLLRCYRCLGFGHVAKQCTNTDRSNRCWRCGEEGHVVRVCTNKPKCMLCQDVEGKAHATGSLKCNAYKEAKARQGWR